LNEAKCAGGKLSARALISSDRDGEGGFIFGLKSQDAGGDYVSSTN
jgi:hypothetical protein